MFKKIKWMVTISIFLILSTIFLFSQVALSKGRWQIGPHYGIWSLSPVESMIENYLGDMLDRELAGLVGPGEDYSQIIDLSSRGSNLGLDVRFYPAGENGSFSIGLAVEKSELRVIMDALIGYELADGGYVDASANAALLLAPTSYLLSLRWDIRASSRLHPYIGFGVGIGTLNGLLTYEGTTILYDAPTDTTTIVTYTGELDIADLLKAAGYQGIPLPILQLNLGLSYKITNNIYLLLDAGIWNGFLVRGGICLRV